MGSRRWYNYDWKEIQEYYDSGHTVVDLRNKFGCSYKSRKAAKENGFFKPRSNRDIQLLAKSNCKYSIEELNQKAEEVAELYKKEYSLRDLIKMGYNQTAYDRAKQLGLLKPRTLSESRKIAIKKYGPNRMGSEGKKKTSKRMSEHNPGGKAKWFTVAGKKVQGTWERDFALYLEEQNIPWRRCKAWPYTINEEQKHYTPDFYLSETDEYIEIKGYWWGNDREKMDAVLEQYPDKNIRIIEKEEFLKEYKR